MFMCCFGSFRMGGGKNTQTKSPPKSRDDPVKILCTCFVLYVFFAPKGNALRAFPGSFRNFSGISSGKSQPCWGCGPETNLGFGKGVCWTRGLFTKVHFLEILENLRVPPGNALRAFPGTFRNFSGISSGKSQPYWWHGPAPPAPGTRKPG